MPCAIYIDGRFFTQPLTGVQRYCREVTRAMDQLLADGYGKGEIELTCLLPPGRLKLPAYRAIKVRQAGVNRGNLWEQIDLPLAAGGELLFSPANIGPFWYRNQVATLHDASVFAVPHAYSWQFRLKYRFVFQQLARRARRLLTDSRFSQSELARYLNHPPQHFQVIPLGADHIRRVDPDTGILKQNGLQPQGYLLVVSSLSPHKNFHRAVQAFLSVASQTRLVIIGGDFRAVFGQSDLDLASERITLLSDISDSSLKALYENAVGLVYPSLYEGFGLPPLEAMACGCPVLCSDSASLPEVCGDAVIYYPATDQNAMAEAIQGLLTQPDLGRKLRSKGFDHSAQFGWRKTARSTLDVLAWEAKNIKANQ